MANEKPRRGPAHVRPGGQHTGRQEGVRRRTDAPPPGRRNAAAEREPLERRIHGVNACLSFFEHHPDRLVRAYFTEDAARRFFGAVMRYCASHRLAYHIIPDAELERVTESSHHEGVCFLVRDPEPLEVGEWLYRHRQSLPSCVLALESVGNPHNLGAILRVCAHFGVKALLMSGVSALRSGAAVRTAEGGAEHVELVEAGGFTRALESLRRAGYRILSTSSHRGQSLYRTRLPLPCVVLFGEEGEGLSQSALAAGDVCVQIPGTGHVESLNVSVAVGVILGELWRQHREER